jgi:hypothetical protein
MTFLGRVTKPIVDCPIHVVDKLPSEVGIVASPDVDTI